MLLRRLGLSATAARVSSSLALATQRRAQADATTAAAPRVLTYEEVWAHWNEGNLFSLQAQQLHTFLSSQKVDADPRSKKAALVRQVEELLQRNDDQAKGVQARVTEATEREKYGKWEAPTIKSETLLDLTQTGFYEAGAKSMAPRAFQVLVAGNSPDLVVSRVNTTMFPSFPSSAECYTLIPADSSLSARARYSKALQWCVLNMRNLQLTGELAVDFGKLLIRDEVVKKSRFVVSAYTLQQRMQMGEPHQWVSCLPESAVQSIVEPLLEANGFAAENEGKAKLSYTVRIERAKNNIEVTLNGKGATTLVAEQWALLQAAHRTSDGGPDVRLTVRSRQPLPRKDTETYTKAPIVEIKDEVKTVLSPELGKVTYCSEDETRSWAKKGDSGASIVVKEIRRQPLIITNDTDADARVELQIIARIPEAAERVDLNAMGNEIFDFAVSLGDALTEEFVAKYATQAAPIQTDLE